MSSHAVLDVVLAALLVLYAVAGYRRGLVASVFALAGILVFGALGLWLLPLLVHQSRAVDNSIFLRSLVLIAGVLILASFGQLLGSALGARIRGMVHPPALRYLDAALGAVASVMVVAVFVWFLAGAARGALPGSAARAVSQSKVLQGINRVVPGQVGGWFAGFQDVLDRHGFPRVFDGLQQEPILPVSPPDDGATRGPGVARASGSIVKITGLSNRCHRGQEGSGWVVAPDKVVTNAHVVAGMTKVAVQVGGTGRSYSGRAVVFDPRRDLAVLSVPGLPAPPMKVGKDLNRADSAVVAGFPLDGPFRLAPARVRGILTARGADIRGNPGVSRQVYSLAAKVQPGNSGGPLLAPSGEVVGTVFARSIEDTDTGYALTMQESARVLKKAGSANVPVDTGACVSR